MASPEVVAQVKRKLVAQGFPVGSPTIAAVIDEYEAMNTNKRRSNAEGHGPTSSEV